ncbi:MAG: SlyX family protein [Marinagarivorans sp.]|nr:SlyX family protein [Marinagarivorans sp.]
MTRELENAIAELQLRVSFQDDAMLKLSDHIALQDKELIETKRQILFFREKLLELIEHAENVGPSGASERPPHY